MLAHDLEFEETFAELVTHEREDLSGRPGGAEIPADIEVRVESALTKFYAGYYTHCAEQLADLECWLGSDARVSALAAACESFRSGRLNPAIQRCLEFLQWGDHLPDLYCILGVLLLRSKRRAESHAAFKSGLHLDPCHEALRFGLEGMGVRQPPVLPFWSRTHPLNRWLGHLREWWQRRNDPVYA